MAGCAGSVDCGSGHASARIECGWGPWNVCVAALVRLPWAAAQAVARVQAPLSRWSPRARSRRRFTAAVRWWSQALFFTTPR